MFRLNICRWVRIYGFDCVDDLIREFHMPHYFKELFVPYGVECTREIDVHCVEVFIAYMRLFNLI